MKLLVNLEGRNPLAAHATAMRSSTGDARLQPACRNGHRVTVADTDRLSRVAGRSCVQTSAMPAMKSTHSAAVSVMSPSAG